jgi:hypothetical protein
MAYYALLSLVKGQSVLKSEKIKFYMTLIRPSATYEAKSWSLYKDIIKRLAIFKTKVLRRVLGGIKVNEN